MARSYARRPDAPIFTSTNVVDAPAMASLLGFSAFQPFGAMLIKHA